MCVSTCYAATEDRDEKRVLGLVILRGESIVRLNAETPPPPMPKVAAVDSGAGVGRAAGRGMPVLPLGQLPNTVGVARGLGAPMPSQMMPQAGRGSLPPPPPVGQLPLPPVGRGQLPPNPYVSR